MIDRLISTNTVMRGFLNCLDVNPVFLVALLSRTDVVVESIHCVTQQRRGRERGLPVAGLEPYKNQDSQ